MNAIKPVTTLTSLQCAMAALCGVQDAQDGRDMEASTLYLVGSKPWRAYYDAYAANSKRPVMPLAELERLCRVPVAVAAHVVVNEMVTAAYWLGRGAPQDFAEAAAEIEQRIANGEFGAADQREDWVGL